MNIVAELRSIATELEVTPDHISEIRTFFAHVLDSLQQIDKLCVMYQMTPDKPLSQYYAAMQEEIKNSLDKRMESNKSEMTFLERMSSKKIYAYSPAKNDREERFKRHLAEVMRDTESSAMNLALTIPYLKTSKVIDVLTSMSFNFRRQY